jgi:hypothetical protein
VERGEEIRLETLSALTTLAVHDRQFRYGLWDDLVGTLERYGFDLNEQEMTQVRNVIYAVRNSIDEDIFSGLTEAHR